MGQVKRTSEARDEERAKEALVQYVKGFEDKPEFEAHRGLYPYGRSKPPFAPRLYPSSPGIYKRA